ncbi:MAG: hypothetical protein UV38_C0003G0168 [candidate division TM6 bacterium GW2011_GWE2_42_60]|nr:MAG: hypothetical protein UV38_C0003G0168 [candidate division TM6 bacterium GW2011_GWE2_42_60]HBY05357.1 hypothetical protein [Candidatus Dependentiae bacterium]
MSQVFIKRISLLFLLGSLGLSLIGKEKPVISTAGFVCIDNCFDTRQTVSKREGHEFLYPKKWDCAACCNDKGEPWRDVNHQASYSIFPINARAKFRIEGEPIFCTDKTYAVVAADFRGVDDQTINLFRLRESYILFDWPKTDLLIGQTFYPLAIDDCGPNTVAYAKSGPLDTWTFCPQIRLVQDLNSQWADPADRLTVAIGSHGRITRFQTPNGSSAQALRNALVPIVHLQWRHYINKDCFIGLCLEEQRLRPLLKTVSPDADGVYYDQRGTAFMEAHAAMYGQLKSDCLVLRGKVTFLQDGHELGYISGYAVESYNVDTKCQTFTPLRSISCWFDVDVFPENDCMPGCLVGFARNLGAGKPLYRDATTNTLITYGDAVDIGTFVKCAPRLWVHKGVLDIGAEVDWSRAWYGDLDDCGAVNQICHVDNLRFQLSLFYRF